MLWGKARGEGAAKRPLTKSRLQSFRQCPKRLWLETYRADAAAAPSPSSRLAFRQGDEIGELARRELSDGVLVDTLDRAEAVKRTRELLQARPRVPIFEAAIDTGALLVRADILRPVARGWELVEVKSSTSAKDHHVTDVATQAWAARKTGLKVARLLIRHVDNRFVLQRPGDFGGLLVDEDVGARARPHVAETARLVGAAGRMLRGREPERPMGDHCAKPHPCPFIDYCRALKPLPAYPLTDLGPKNGFAGALAARGFEDLAKIPVSIPAPNAKAARILEAVRTGRPFHDEAGFRAAVAAWGEPRFHLDFETIAFAAPRWPGTRPYEHAPFQFSCLKEHADGRVERVAAHLDLSGDDPRRACAEALLAALGTGSEAIVTYNASFERGCVTRLAEAFPDLSGRLIAVRDRIVDLLPVVREHYYHRDLHGSFSLKVVTECVAPELGYAGLEGVQEGGGAQAAYLEATGADTTDQRKAELRDQLLRYCERDTLVMVVVLRRLAGLSAKMPAEMM